MSRDIDKVGIATETDEMAQFFRLAASDTPRAAHPHSNVGLELHTRWLANRGGCSILLTSVARRRQARRVQLAAGSG